MTVTLTILTEQTEQLHHACLYFIILNNFDGINQPARNGEVGTVQSYDKTKKSRMV